jgi:hypothetical protein
MGHSADGFGLAQIIWASQIGLEARSARAGSPRPKQESSLPMARCATVAVDSGRWRNGQAGKPAGDHHGGVGGRFEGRGRRGAHRSSAPHGGAVGGGGSPVRGRWSGPGRSLCGRRGAPGRGDACGGGDEARGGPERPAHGGVPDGEEEGGLSSGGDRRLWLGHTSRKSVEWSERCAGPVRSSWRLK